MDQRGQLVHRIELAHRAEIFVKFQHRLLTVDIAGEVRHKRLAGHSGVFTAVHRGALADAGGCGPPLAVQINAGQVDARAGLQGRGGVVLVQRRRAELSAADALAAHEELPLQAAELVAAAYCFGEAGCALAVVELPDAGLAEALPQMPVCAVTSVGPDGVSRSVERLAALAGGVMRKGSICVTAPEQPKAVLSELIVAAGKCDCELVVPDPEDITFLEAEKFASKVDYGGYTVPLAFLGRHAAGNAAMAVELALALCRKGFDIPDEAILDGLAAVKNRSSIRVISQRPLVILDACRTPQQASALLRVLNMAKVRHMSAIIGLAEEEGAEAFFSALETGLTPEEQKKDKSTMPGMSDNPFDKVYLVTPTGGDDAMTERLTEKAKFHFDAELCATLAEAVELAHANTRRGLLVCGSEAAALEAAALLENS